MSPPAPARSSRPKARTTGPPSRAPVGVEAWTDGAKVALASALMIPFAISWLVRTYLLLGDPTLSPYVERAYLPILQPFLWAQLVGHLGLASIGFVMRRVRRRIPWLVHLEIQLWFVCTAVLLYATGTLTSPLIVLAVVLPIVGYLLFPPRAMHLGIATMTTGVVLGVALPLAGWLPYAPFLASAPFEDHVLIPFWALSFGVPTFLAAAISVGVHVRLVDQLRARQVELERLSSTDALTQLKNRATFYARLAEEVARAHRHGQPLTLLMLDADHFKSINDTAGHVAGDHVLVELADRIRSTLRTGDLAARYGGEEFAVLLPHTRLVEATTVAERLLAAARTIERPEREGVAHLTVSIGMAELGSDEDGESLVLRADDALYRSKDAGRDRLTLG